MVQIYFRWSMNINRRYLCLNLLPRIYSIGFDGSKTRHLSGKNRFYFDEIRIVSETTVRIVENCVWKWPIAEHSTHRKVANRGADIKFWCPSEAQIDTPKYPSHARLGLFCIASDWSSVPDAMTIFNNIWQWHFYERLWNISEL